MEKIIQNSETIVALCTPQGKGAIALLRMSGPSAVEIATRISTLASGKKLTDLPTHTIHFGAVIDKQGKPIDQVLFLLMRGPKTFTGEDTVEITTHNNPFIVSAIIEQAVQAGARLAQEGEFSKRAFLNGKLDLHQAEAINELIHAQTQQALKASLAQLEGSLSHKLKGFEEKLLEALALSEASFEFIEDEQTEFCKNITAIIKRVAADIEALKKSHGQQKQIREGIRIALIGSVNAGKSSLFNLLLSQKRSIVTNIPGTTRDVIEAGQYRDGTYITFIDTAGLRQTQDIIEQEGIRRSMEQAQQADIILLVKDCSRAATKQEEKIYQDLEKSFGKKLIIVKNKADLNSTENIHIGHVISCKTGRNIEALTQDIDKKIENLFSDLASPFLLNQRQYSKLIPLENHLESALQLLNNQPAYELVSFELKKSLEQLAELSGKTISKQAIDHIFNQFCIGK